jgi:lipopolysaccharide transport system ATP-binding protein
MGLRLGFAVAAHLEPEILVVDEVLAVGDAQFQKKCLGKMSDVASEGRTVLFVSHNMGAVSRITQNCYWLEQGILFSHGATEDIVPQYLRRYIDSSDSRFFGEKDGPLALDKVELLDDQLQTIQRPLFFGESFAVVTYWTAKRDLPQFALFTRIEAEDGTIVGTTNSLDQHKYGAVGANETYRLTWRSVGNVLVPGRYYLTLSVHDQSGMPLDLFQHVMEFQISEIHAPVRFSKSSAKLGGRTGYIYLQGEWELSE